MTDPVSSFNRLDRVDTSSAQKADKTARRDAAAKTQSADLKGSASVQPRDELELSEVARQAVQEPQFDRAKVDAIKQALKDGQYPLDARRIAESFVAIEKMIKG